MHKELVLSYVLAIAVVGGAIWMLEGPLSQTMKGNPRETMSSSMPQPQKSVTTEDTDQTVSSRQPEAKAQDNFPQRGTINKCIVNGKAIYSDETCPAGADVKSVELHDSAGIVSPAKEVLSELTARRKVAELAAEREAQQQPAHAAQPGRNECKELDNRIEHLDASARQLQSGQMQDWIKEQRQSARDRQFAIHC